ncbi:MAG: hypothetical protein A3F83_14865 [Candidatus Glassbacteria bacterium RIFCSPLOWO2_12_FULL_58_11]|uniref:Cyclic nucleotide-binding domain-containing protein n=1 Tax=Candidatus Glassbacteria bacterium RIFCSPLOWO2_12_FULL_58_11 TaxID=1817867 RepID=A0A1F5Z2Y3_9BACT|nr:MAG: hypothetical protein A3F83_14865 [Candidatus Glassbacteria bacterium RIFCSPLOWO2_12_FULL_58_11]
MGNHLEKTFCKGEVIIKEGHAGSTFYVILDGMVEVLKRRGGKEEVLNVLGPSEFFGEMSLIDSSLGKRSATIRALEDTRVAIMSKEDFEQYLGKLSPGVRNLLSRLTARLKRAIEQSGGQRPVRAATGEEAEGKEAAEEKEPTIDYTLTLDELEKARAHAVDVKFLQKKFRKGQVIIRQGESGHCGFIVRKGQLEVSRISAGRKVVLNVLGENDILGENAMFEDSHRSATVIALTDGELLVFGKRDMISMARQSPLELFMIMDSMSSKLDQTNEKYCEAVIEQSKLQAKIDRLSEEMIELSTRLEKAEAEKARLEEKIAGSGPQAAADNFPPG